MKRELWVRWGSFAGVWTLLGVFFSTQAFVFSRLYERPQSLAHSLLSNLPDWYIWGGFSLLIGWLFRSFPLKKGQLVRSLAVHIPASLIIAMLSLALAVASLFVFVISSEETRVTFWPVMNRNLAMNYHWWVLVYWAILGTYQGLDYNRKLRERENRTVQLEAQLVQAQLQALKMQLQPHFLFNTLHSISALLHQDIEAADRMIARLGEFLRLTLENSGEHEVTLQKEMEFLRCYLEIERIRFQDRLTVRYEVDPQALNALVPNLLWQPIVENAIRHGIAPRPGPGCIEVRAQCLGERLQLQVKDNGPGLHPGQTLNGSLNEGVGLANTRARLRQLYSNDHWFGLCNGLDGGLVVTLEIPFKAASTLAEEPVGEVQWR